jgi:hypothetical protein
MGVRIGIGAVGSPSTHHDLLEARLEHYTHVFQCGGHLGKTREAEGGGRRNEAGKEREGG